MKITGTRRGHGSGGGVVAVLAKSHTFNRETTVTKAEKAAGLENRKWVPQD